MTDLPQPNSSPQNSHTNEEFINVNSVGNYDDQIKNDPLIKSKLEERWRYYWCITVRVIQ